MGQGEFCPKGALTMSLLQNEEDPQAVYRALPSDSPSSTAYKNRDITHLESVLLFHLQQLLSITHSFWGPSSRTFSLFTKKV